MGDFTSALYLGFTHDSQQLPGWAALTTGRPASLQESALSVATAAAAAAAVGCSQGALFPSTLHLLLDLLAWMGRGRGGFAWDEGLYPVARWGMERAVSQGAPSLSYPHRDARGGVAAMKSLANRGKVPVAVTDGFCPACGGASPLNDLAEAAGRLGGWLVVDDTQGIGILGKTPTSTSPWGEGGVGTAAWLGVPLDRVILASSLAKAFGAPLAVLAGPEEVVAPFLETSSTRLHCSPPSMATVGAAARALEVNTLTGDRRRKRALQVVEGFRRRLGERGWRAAGHPFPVQSVTLEREMASILWKELVRQGHQALLQRGERVDQVRITFLLTARHTDKDLDELFTAWDHVLGGRQRGAA